MKRPRVGVVAALVVLVLASGALAEIAPTGTGTQPVGTVTQGIPVAPTRWVTDDAGILSPTTRQELDQQLEALERRTGNQVIVWIGRSLGGAPLEEWAARTFTAWGIGRRGKDDGAALFLLADERRVRIEVGYGLEDRLTDLKAARIIRDVIVPGLRRGDQDGAVRGAVGAMVAAVDPTAPGAAPIERVPAARPAPQTEVGWGTLALLGLAGVGFLFLLMRNPGLAAHLLLTVLSSHGRRGSSWGGGGGGFSGGGGGFSGGGGRSGGGGASGSW